LEFFNNVKSVYKGTKIEKEVPHILFFLNRWEFMSAILRVIYILLGISSVFFSLLAAVQIGSIQEEYAKIFAFIAAVSIAFMTAFNLTDKSNNVRDAWRELNAGVMKYNNKLINKDQLIEIYRVQEGKIGGVFFSKG
jgi:hypothetical protein